ncbi:site-specific integrase [Saccharothrix sp.]|uniref:tyrosine-type recombinase/integrase n=1 Tax=Saccharothrix sp. TaxID=1873460 RepID=UPI0028116208|nr:site-specific integrase [Saccharothrix sp.]
MAPQDLWHLKKTVKGPDGKEQRARSKRYGRGKRWRVSYVDPHTGRTRNPSFRTLAEAERFENNMKADISRGKYVDPKAGQILVEDYADQWVSRLQKRPGTNYKYKSAVENHIKPVLGRLPMAQVRSGTIQDWVTDRRTATNDRDALAASTIRTIYSGVLYPMFKRAVTDQLIAANPCVDIVLPELPEGEYDLPTADQVSLLADNIDNAYRAAIHLAAGCGTRAGELFGLELDAVDFLRRVVHIRQQLVMSPTSGRPYLAPLKTRTSKRTIELPTFAGEALASHIALHPPEPVLIWDRTNPDKPRQRKARLLFLDLNGKPMCGTRWAKFWAAGVEQAGLPVGTYTTTSLRHFFATALIYAGKNVKTVQMAMGHAKPTITLETYLGYWPDDERNGTRAVIDAAFTALSGASRTQSVPNDLGRT